MQIKKLEDAKVPEWEKEIVRQAYDFERKESHAILKELEVLMNGKEGI